MSYEGKIFLALGIVFLIGFPALVWDFFEERRMLLRKPPREAEFGIGHLVLVPTGCALVVAALMLLGAAIISDWMEPSGR